MKNILFSPVGFTDPIRDCHDGAMLHILRKYVPDKVYLYMTKGILEIHNNTNIYAKAIKKLSEKKGKDIETVIIEDPNMINPQEYVFYDKFKKYLRDIENENKECKIIFNISSGTPAIKSTLQAIYSLSKGKYLAIQVATPKNAANEDMPHDNKEDIEILWELNNDNKADYKDRCSIADNYIAETILKENVKKLIEECDYDAALMIVKENVICDDKVRKLLNAAKARFELNFSGVDKEIDNDEKKYFCANQDGGQKLLIEYILTLQIKLKKTFFGDFIRSITPITADLFEKMLDKYNINIKRLIIEKNKNGIKLMEIDVEKVKEYDEGLYNYMLSAYKGNFKNADISTDNMLKIIEYYSENGKIKKNDYEIAKNIREIEKNIRNTAAHEIVSITESKIKEKTLYTPKQIFEEIIRFAKIVGINIDDEMLKSYNIMNNYIKDLII